MAKAKDAGVFKMENGLWAYRFAIMIDGKQVARRKSTDEHGNKLHTKKEAIRAREAAIEQAHLERNRQKKLSRRTVKEVYSEYCKNGRSDRAYQTIRKQDSLWDNHLCTRFGSRFVDDISVAEIYDYLSELYYNSGLAYTYVESFLKMFYLIFGQAYSRNYLEVDTYNKLCVNKDVRIRMPKMKVDEDTEIVVFTREEVERLDSYFQGTNAETAYLLGRCCGLRINECYGLKWENIDTAKGTITVDRQMQYQEGLIKLVSLKTRNARRTVYMSDKLKAYLQHLERENKVQAAALAAQREQNQTFITDIDGKQISSLELVNTLPNGKIQTVNSMKYHSKNIKQKLRIHFKFHYLRHTYGTRLAEMNTPTHILCNQMGHASGKVTERYYLAVSKPGIEVLTRNLNNM